MTITQTQELLIKLLTPALKQTKINYRFGVSDNPALLRVVNGDTHIIFCQATLDEHTLLLRRHRYSNCFKLSLLQQLNTDELAEILSQFLRTSRG